MRQRVARPLPSEKKVGSINIDYRLNLASVLRYDSSTHLLILSPTYLQFIGHIYRQIVRPTRCVGDQRIQKAQALSLKPQAKYSVKNSQFGCLKWPVSGMHKKTMA